MSEELDRASDHEQNSEFCSVPQLTDRMLIDLVNGLEVSAEHIRYRGQESWNDRVSGFLSGSARQRLNRILENHQGSLESFVEWMKELTGQRTHSAQALAQILKTLHEIGQASSKYGAVGEQNAKLLRNLEAAIGECSRPMATLAAEQKIRKLTTGWESGMLFDGYPVLLQAALAFDALALDLEPQFRNQIYQETCLVMQHLVANSPHPLRRNYKPLVDGWLAEFCSAELTEPRKSIVLYVLQTARPESLVHMIREYATTGRAPDWVKARQDSGDFPVMASLQYLLRRIADEFMPRLPARS